MVEEVYTPSKETTLTQEEINMLQADSHAVKEMGESNLVLSKENDKRTRMEENTFDPNKKKKKTQDCSLLLNNSKTKYEGMINTAECNRWTKEQVLSLLCNDQEKGGAGLMIEKVKTLYDNGFDGYCIASIITNIQKRDDKFALKRLERIFTMAGIPLTLDLSTTLEIVVNWVDNLLKSHITNDSIQPVHMKFKGVTHLEHLKKFTQNPEELYNSAYEKQTYSITTTTLEQIIQCNEGLSLNPACLSLCSITGIIPIFDGTFAKHYIPYIQSLQIETKIDKAMSEEIQNQPKNSFVLLSTTGIGKTATIIKALSKYPGIYISGSCCTDVGSDQIIDSCSKSFVSNCSGSDYMRIYATVRQQCQLLLQSKLLHITRLIDHVVKDQSVLNSFQGSLLSFLAFNQANGNTEYESVMFNKLQIFVGCKIELMRSITIQLVDNLLEKLKLLNVNNQNFLFCVDEAQIFEE